MSLRRRRLWWGLTRNAAITDPASEDPRLRGRTYAIPFEQVWQAALALANGGLRRWKLVHSDDQEGIIRAEAARLLRRTMDDVTIHISLDQDAQTRVDARAQARQGRFDLGANARRIGRFFRALDRALARSRADGPGLPQRIGG